MPGFQSQGVTEIGKIAMYVKSQVEKKKIVKELGLKSTLVKLAMDGWIQIQLTITRARYRDYKRKTC